MLIRVHSRLSWRLGPPTLRHMEGSLTNPELRKLKALAQRLEPVLHIGKAGLSEGFYKSLEQALLCHELVKIKFSAFKEEKKELTPQLVEKSGTSLVMRVGNVAVVYRAHPEPDKRRILPVAIV